MVYIQNIYLWKDTGFTEGSVEYPSIDSLSVLPTPDVTLGYDLYHPDPADIFRPSREELFSSVKVQYPYYSLYEMSYVKFDFLFEAPTPEQHQPVPGITVYGWIDSVEMLSDTSASPVCRINWHPDYWRTFASSASYDYGRVTRRPRGSSDPIQVCPYRYRLPGEFTPLAVSSVTDIAWLYICFNDKYTVGIGENPPTYATVKTGVIPVWTSASKIHDHVYFKAGNDGTEHESISLANVIYNQFDEYLGLDPDNISSAYISRVPPFEVASGSGTSASPLVLSAGEQPGTVIVPYSDVSNHVTNVQRISSANYKVFWSDGSQNIYSNLQLDDSKLKPYGQFNAATFKYKVDGGSLQTDYFYIAKVDDYVKEVIGIDNWNALQANDTVIFDEGITICSGYSATVSPGSPTQVAFTLTNPQYDVTNLVFHSGSFGSNTYVIIKHPNGVLRIASEALPSLFEIVIEKTQHGDSTVGYYITSKSGNYSETSHTLTTPLITTDTKEWVFTDHTGSAIGTAPWGIELESYTVRPIVTTTGGYIEYRFGGINSKSQGTCYTIPMEGVDVVSNAWSSYVYSGQRDYDIEQRKIANEQALISGVTSALSGGISSGIMSGIGSTKSKSSTERIVDHAGDSSAYNIYGDTCTGTTSYRPYMKEITNVSRVTKSAMGIGKAFGLQAGMGAAGAGLEYVLNLGYNDRLQSNEDMLKAKQAESIIAYGNGWDWLWKGRDAGFISLVPDDYSLNQFNNVIEYNGIECSEIHPNDMDGIIRTSYGPLEVQDLIITGDIPVQAKKALKVILSNGVRLIHTDQPSP